MTARANQRLPLEATAHFLVDQHLAGNSAILEFMQGLDAYQLERFEQIAQDIGYSLFQNGLQRLGGQRQLDPENLARVLVRETELALMGSAAYVDYLDR